MFKPTESLSIKVVWKAAMLRKRIDDGKAEANKYISSYSSRLIDPAVAIRADALKLSFVQSNACQPHLLGRAGSNRDYVVCQTCTAIERR
jgi:hypothetical protein